MSELLPSWYAILQTLNRRINKDFRDYGLSIGEELIGVSEDMPPLCQLPTHKGLLKNFGIVISESARCQQFFPCRPIVFVVDLSVFVDRRLAVGHQAGFAGVISSPSVGYDFV